MAGRRIATESKSDRFLHKSCAPDSLRTQFLSRNPQDFPHLLIPVLPIVIAGQLPVLVRDFLLSQQCCELRVVVGQNVLSSTVEIKVRQRRDPRGGRVAHELVDVICLARVGTHRPKDAEH